MKFTVEYQERTGGGGPPVGKNDLKLAGQAYDEGKAAKFAELLSKALGRPVELVDGNKDATVLNLARAIKDNRKRLSDEVERQQKEQLAMA